MELLPQKKNLSILIPVYNAADHLKDLFISLQNNTDFTLVKEIIIGNDDSNEMTTLLIESISFPCPIKIINRESSVGCLKNRNDLYAQATGDIAVFLNAEILLPPCWVERMIASFIEDTQIVLAMPFSTNAANLTILPNVGQSWLDIDRCLYSFKPSYMDAYTTTGSCMAVAKYLFGNSEALFDESYLQGHGEETDLHYRVLARGYRSVVINNLLVYHGRGNDFFFDEHINTCENQQVSNEKNAIFQQKWKTVHLEREKHYLKTKPYDNFRLNDHYFLYKQKKQTIEILFVLPTVIPQSGGIQVVLDIIKYLIINNIKGAIYCYNQVNQPYVDFISLFNPWLSIEKLKENVAEIKCVCATHYSSFSISEEISAIYKSKILYLVQGPEGLFSCGMAFGKVINDYRRDDITLFCMSSFLKEYLQKYTNNEAVTLSLGANNYIFYPMRKVKRLPKTIAACLRLGESKGTGIMLYALTLAKEAGFKIHLFGALSDKFDLPDNFAVLHGNLNRTELRELFNSVEYYLDMSSFEGLGLLSLEAAYCGAIPLISHNGGGDYVFKEGENAFFIDNIFKQSYFFKDLLNKSAQVTELIRSHCLKLSQKYSIQKAVEEFLFELTKMGVLPSSYSNANDFRTIPQYNKYVLMGRRALHKLLKVKKAARAILAKKP